MNLLQLHFALVTFWLGLLAAESVLELCARDNSALRAAANVHRWIDVLFEGPVVIAILVTGAVLLARAWPVAPIVQVHVGLGLIPLLVNLACMGWVLARAGACDDGRLRALTLRVKLTGLGIPFVIAAFVVGVALLPGR